MKHKIIDVRFEAVACFSITIEVNKKQYNEMRKLCKKESPFLLKEDFLHGLLMQNISIDSFDYINKSEDIEEIEFDDYFNH